MPIKLPVITEYNPKGFKQANKGIAGLKKAIAGLGVGAALFKIGSLGFEFAKMAQTDKVSQDLMNATLKRTTKTTEAGMKANEAFIQTLSNQVGIIDDNLRPALAGLARVSGSTSKAQKLLQIALDASAMSGKPLETTSKAVAKAYAGNTVALKKMFPELAKTEAKFIAVHGAAKTVAQKTDLARTMLAALGKEAAGQALIKATPFDKFNVAMDNMKEKLGALILPKLTDFIGKLLKPGGSFDQLSAFVDQMSDPKTDAGKAIKNIGDSMSSAVKGVDTFFAAFDPKTQSGVQGFLNVAGFLTGLASGITNFVGGAGQFLANINGESLTPSMGAIKGHPGAGLNLSSGGGGVGGSVTGNPQNGRTTIINNVNVSAGLGANGQDIGKAIVAELKKYSRKNGVSFANIIQ
jgi:hypothetical protein